MIRIGVLGAGGIVPPHLAAAASHRRARVVHIADVRPEAARRLAEEYGIARVSEDPGAVIADERVDAVVVALPTFLHHEWLLRCAERGKHILTEKPLCRTLAQARQVMEACTATGVRLAVGYQRRFSPARVKIRELVRSGALGRPVTWTISAFGPRSDFYRGPNNWMWDRDQGGGLVMDGSIHDFDFACWVLGPPVGMFAHSRCISAAATAPTQAAAIVGFEEGDSLVYGVSWQEGDYGSGTPPQSIVGPQGTLVLESEFSFTWHHAPGKRRHCSWDPGRLRPAVLHGQWLFYRQLDGFIRWVEGCEPGPCLATGEDALASLWLAESIVAAGPHGRVFHAGEEGVPPARGTGA